MQVSLDQLLKTFSAPLDSVLDTSLSVVRTRYGLETEESLFDARHGRKCFSSPTRPSVPEARQVSHIMGYWNSLHGVTVVAA